MTSLQVYRDANRKNWTRIEMLLAIYDGIESNLAHAISAQQNGDKGVIAVVQLKVTRLILLLLEGIPSRTDENTENIRRLCVFMIQHLATDSPERFDSVLSLITTLKNAFTAIQQEAMELEAAGEIPPLDYSSVAHATSA